MTESEVFRMDGTLKRLLLVYSGAFVIGAVLTYIYVIMLVKMGHLILLILAVPLYIYVFSDLFLWMRKGVRSVEIDSSGLIVYRMNAQTPDRLEADQVTGVYVSRFLDRTTINIVLRGGTVKSFLGIKRYSGPRIRMTNEPYDRAQFLEFTRRVTNLRRIAQIQQ
jgi:hypothetical protein